jgi:hypothetical protein
MAINVAGASKDALGFPRLDWYEDRKTQKQVCCSAYITTGLFPGALYFAADGGFLKDSVFKKRPWDKLVGFRVAKARDLYYSTTETRMREILKQEFLYFRATLDDDATVILADVADENSSIPMHLSYGLGTPYEVERLHSALHQAFILNRQSTIDSHCSGEYKLPPQADPWLVDERRIQGLKALNESYFKERTFWDWFFGRR